MGRDGAKLTGDYFSPMSVQRRVICLAATPHCCVRGMGREGVVSGVRTFLRETASTYVLLCTFIQANVTGSSAYHFSLAERHAGSPCITNSVDDVHFDHTIGVGQVVNIKAKVNGAFTSSMKVCGDIFFLYYYLCVVQRRASIEFGCTPKCCLTASHSAPTPSRFHFRVTFLMVQSSSSVSLRDPYLIALPLRNTPGEKFSVQASVSARSPTQDLLLQPGHTGSPPLYLQRHRRPFFHLSLLQQVPRGEQRQPSHPAPSDL
ncbi:unnamed protein product [Oncorhynchus mykiss]|uniref:Uncharacterized protein n=1 Tax=Oncorhynchus mykiss TaxID=8022 RepID=A0A060WYN3_ONCMY|nr:unnamed protein product [Oncorhynchus mykiss]